MSTEKDSTTEIKEVSHFEMNKSTESVGERFFILLKNTEADINMTQLVGGLGGASLSPSPVSSRKKPFSNFKSRRAIAKKQSWNHDVSSNRILSGKKSIRSFHSIGLEIGLKDKKAKSKDKIVNKTYPTKDIRKYGYIDTIDKPNNCITISTFEILENKNISDPTEEFTYSLNSFDKIVNELNELDPIILEITYSPDRETIYQLSPRIPTENEANEISKKILEYWRENL